jgi:hypothetical protein
VTDGRLLDPSTERDRREHRRAQEQAEDELADRRKRRRMLWQCVALTFIGVPVYAYSWHLTDPRQAEVAASAGFVLSYAAPFFRWLAYHISQSEEFRR